jgi:hypothetical protein
VSVEARPGDTQKQDLAEACVQDASRWFQHCGSERNNVAGHDSPYTTDNKRSALAESDFNALYKTQK